MQKRALISVSDKTGVVALAQGLADLGFEIVSTGGTYKKLAEAGISSLITIETLTGFPEGLEGRIKTLTPQVFGGVLAERHKPAHVDFLTENNLPLIDVVVVNLYPFHANYFDESKNFEAKVEQIDIGGPSMIRAAAKNYKYCLPVVDPADYDAVLAHFKSGEENQALKKRLAAKTFAMTAHYDLLIAKFWTENAEIKPLRYGENPHQTAAAVADPFVGDSASLLHAEVLNGKPLSYNNYADASAALDLALSFDVATPFATILKHAQPCGAAIGADLLDAFERAHECDPVSSFGGVIAVNQTLTKAVAEKIIGFFNEIVIAPDYEDGAVEILAQKKNLRVLKIKNWNMGQGITAKTVRGGTLLQDRDDFVPVLSDLKVVTKAQVSEKEMQQALAAWKMVKVVRSNAIVAAKDGAMVGKGGGQTSRVDAMNICLKQAGEKSKGAIIASDAFFPFADNIELAKNAGISVIIQPGGSIKDAEVIAAADKAGIAMIFTGTRAFLH